MFSAPVILGSVSTMATRVQSCITWRFVGKTRRHEVELRHNTISGKQLLTVNGEILHRINWKYKLTGEATSFQCSPMTWECSTQTMQGTCIGNATDRFASYISGPMVRSDCCSGE